MGIAHQVLEGEAGRDNAGLSARFGLGHQHAKCVVQSGQAANIGFGMIGIFNRSHYEDVLIVRVDNIVPEAVWRPRYDRINAFEQLLVESGTTVLKFYLHISKKEQKERFEARLADPTRHWKFAVGDLRKREQWGDYIKAFEETLTRCTTEHAPWYVIPADQKWYRNLAISRIIVETLKQMNPQFPEAEDLSGVTIE